MGVRANPDEVRLAEAIYLDTNVLRKLSHGETASDFVELREKATRIGLSVFAPEVAVREWIESGVDDAHASLRKLKDAAGKLGQSLGRDPINHDEPADVALTVRRRMVEYLDSAKISVVRTPPGLSLEMLLDMAVQHEAPFEMEDKGFKDTLILFTIIDHMRSEGLSRSILVSGDAVFNHDHVKNRLSEERLVLEVAKNMKEASKLLDTQFGEAVAIWNAQDQERIKSLLTRQFDRVAKFIIERGAVSPSYFSGGLFAERRLPPGVSPKRILAVRPKEVREVFPGLTLTRTPIPEGMIAVTFSVAVQFDLIVDRYPIPFLAGPSVPLSNPQEYQLDSILPAPPVEEQTTVIADISVEAAVREREGEYSELTLLNVLA
jgi:hypothetical protein